MERTKFHPHHKYAHGFGVEHSKNPLPRLKILFDEPDSDIRLCPSFASIHVVHVCRENISESSFCDHKW
jgi:hypothetical protein